ncbi:hypothetical protein ACE1SV_37850 [Streptomyces sennicomposti]
MSTRFDSVTVACDGDVVPDALGLTVAPGEVMGSSGRPGAGGTTALRAVAGFVRPASGRVPLGGGTGRTWQRLVPGDRRCEDHTALIRPGSLAAGAD